MFTRTSAAVWPVAALALSLAACRAHAVTAALGGSAGVSAGTAAGAASGTDSTSRSSSPSTGSITIPDVTGQRRDAAEARLRAAGVRGRIAVHESSNNVDVATARVCRQMPAAGQATRPDLLVTLQYCAPQVAAADPGIRLVGYPVAEAMQRARDAGLRGTISVSELHEFDASCPAGTVCRITPLRWEIDPTIDLTLYINRKLVIRTPD